MPAATIIILLTKNKRSNITIHTTTLDKMTMTHSSSSSSCSSEATMSSSLSSSSSSSSKRRRRTRTKKVQFRKTVQIHEIQNVCEFDGIQTNDLWYTSEEYNQFYKVVNDTEEVERAQTVTEAIQSVLLCQAFIRRVDDEIDMDENQKHTVARIYSEYCRHSQETAYLTGLRIARWVKLYREELDDSDSHGRRSRRRLLLLRQQSQRTLIEDTTSIISENNDHGSVSSISSSFTSSSSSSEKSLVYRRQRERYLRSKKQ